MRDYIHIKLDTNYCPLVTAKNHQLIYRVRNQTDLLLEVRSFVKNAPVNLCSKVTRGS